METSDDRLKAKVESTDSELKDSNPDNVIGKEIKDVAKEVNGHALHVNGTTNGIDTEKTSDSTCKKSDLFKVPKSLKRLAAQGRFKVPKLNDQPSRPIVDTVG